MKQEYIYDKGNVTAYDDKLGLCEPVSYQDNIEKIFETENIIEEIEEKLPLLKNEKKNFEDLAKSNKKIIPLLFLGFTLPAFILPSLVTYIFCLLTNIEFSSMYIIGNVHFVEVFMSLITPAFTLAGIVYSGVGYSYYKEHLKKAKGVEKQIEFLQNKIKTEKENLYELKQDKTKENETLIEQKSKRKINKENLVELKELLKLYFNIGFNEEKYIKYYNDGSLYKKIKGKYNEEEVDIIESYISDKAKTLKKEYNG